MACSKRLWSVLVFAVMVFAVAMLLVQRQPLPALHPGIHLVQSEIPVMPENLGRISWGAVIAGVILALVIQLALNLLGIAIGTTQLDPYDKDAPTVKTLTSTAVFWIGFSMIVSMIVGGWAAARFAGIPDNLDGVLHGLLVWGLVTLVTILLLSSALGRLISGVNILFQHSLDLIGQVTGTIAQGTATVVQGAASVAQDVAQKAGEATQDAVSTGKDAVQHELDEHPEVKQMLQNQTAARSAIEEEVRKLLGDAGIAPQQVENTVDTAKNEVIDAAKDAAEQAQQGNLEQAGQTLMSALQTVLDQGREVTQQVDRDKVLNLITSNTKMSKEDAQNALEQWETKYHEAKQQTDQVRQQVSSQLEQAQASAKAKLEQVKADAEKTAREAADQARKALGRVALALFAALVVSAIAAGLGGLLGAPHELPVAAVDTTRYVTPLT
jgi:hypothetical protein